MTTELTPMEQVVPLRSFGALAEALVEQPRPLGNDSEGAVSWSRLVRGECVQCGMKVSGEALIALTAPAPDEGYDPKVERLRRGYCARKGCESYFYRLSFRPSPGFDWAAAIARSTGEGGRREARKEEVETGEIPVARRRFLREAAWRGGVGLSALGALWLGRHWSRGGRIPLIREPERFEVDVLSEEDREALESWRAYRPR